MEVYSAREAAIKNAKVLIESIANGAYEGLFEEDGNMYSFEQEDEENNSDCDDEMFECIGGEYSKRLQGNLPWEN